MKSKFSQERLDRLDDNLAKMQKWQKDTKKVVHGGFTYPQLHAAFVLVQDLTNWKNPVDAIIHRDDTGQVCAAISFYGAGAATFSPVPGYPDLVRVTAPGYYVNMPGG